MWQPTSEMPLRGAVIVVWPAGKVAEVASVS